MPHVLVTSGANAGQAFDLHQGEQIIGRGEGSEILLEDSTVSHNHAILRVHGRRVTVEDLRSTNGTRVNGVTIERQTSLTPGDQLDVGGVTLILEQQWTADPNEP
jgi:pSer/pThr/pTyr-binding forkhead associated (FHA) protein